ncbi:MAG: hypothetical protein DRJ49_02570 [Thermoprotei archaeon]|nr:MAG: hypothetical protein DRJ49_02570 [Thermoprotei archaeon]RLG35977.1 MAG: hypothetical protein DRN91_08905 [Candidatus Alkanophagales archaeon]
MEEEDSSSDLKLNSQMRVLLVRAIIITTAGGITGGLGIIYLKEVLGVDAIFLGSMTSLMSIVLLLTILFGGWFSDTFGRRKAFIIGSTLACIPSLIFFLAWDKIVLIPAYIISAIASSFIAPSYQYILRVVTSDKSRGTSIAKIDMLTSIISVIIPPLSTALIPLLGGIPILRYIFAAQFILMLIATLYTASKLKVPETTTNDPKVSAKEFVKSIIDVYRISRERRLHYWILFVAMGPLVFTIVSPFWSLYAYEICKTPTYLMGMLSTAQALPYILLLLPISRLSDRIGRRKIIFGLRPFLWLTFTVLVLASTFQTPYSFIAPLIAWGLYGIFATSSPSVVSTLVESFPKEYLSRWTSFRNFVYYLFAIPCGLLGGLLWNIDPRLPFIVALVADMARSTFLLKIPETLIQKPPSVQIREPRHIIVYELPGAGLGTIARLLSNRLRLQVIDSRVVENNIDRVKEPALIEGENGLIAARGKEDTLVILLVAPRHNRAMKKVQEEGKPLFVAFKEVEEEDKKVSKIIKKHFKADIENLPPFDIAINTERIPLEIVEEVIELTYRELKSKSKKDTSKTFRS